MAYNRSSEVRYDNSKEYLSAYATNLILDKEREIEGILEAMNKFNLKEGLILTENQEDEIKVEDKTIRIIPVWKWLLEE